MEKRSSVSESLKPVDDSPDNLQDAYDDRQLWPDQIWFAQDTDEQIILPPRQDSYVFGDPDYPIAQYRDMIVDTVGDNPVTIVASGTGNGKSISIVQFLYESGKYRHIYQTQPRVVATRENAQFTLQQMSDAAGLDMSDTLVYRTAVEGDTVRATHAIREHTDGYLLQQLLVHEDKLTADDVLIVDEAHERNPNIDVAIAIALERGVRLVVQSASIDTDRWAMYCSKVLGNIDVPVLDLPGVMHPVEHKIGDAMEREIVKYAHMNLDEPLNIGALLPGKRAINDVIGRIQNKVPATYSLFPLHAEQSVAEQRRIMEEYPGGKIIAATEILRQSVTVPGLDVMLDAGFTRSGDYVQGIRYLREHPVSRTGIIQGSGRVGRTGPGIYVHTKLTNYPDIPRDENGSLLIDEHDVPSILRTDLAPLVLRLGRGGLQLEDIALQDMPPANEREYAHHKLVRLGAQALNSTELTATGEKMSALPLDPHYARMFIESQLYSQNIEMQMAAMISAMQQEGIVKTEQGCEQWRVLTSERRSDMLAQLDILLQARDMSTSDLERFNIIDRRMTKTRRLFERIARKRGYDFDDVRVPTDQERQVLIGCMIAGADKLFVGYGTSYTDGASFSGRLAKSSTIRPGHQLLIGSGLVIEHYRGGRKKAHSVITNATAVTPEQLVRHAPSRCTYGEGREQLAADGSVQRIGRDLYFDGHATGTVVETEPSTETTEAVVQAMLNGYETRQKSSKLVKEVFGEIDRIRELLVHRSDRREEYDTFMDMIRQSIIRMKDIEVADMHQLADIMQRRGIDAILKNSYTAESADTQEILRRSPATVMVTIGSDIHQVEVRYQHNDAYLNIPTHAIKDTSKYGLEEQLDGRTIYVWLDQGQTKPCEISVAIEQSRRGNRSRRRTKNIESKD